MRSAPGQADANWAQAWSSLMLTLRERGDLAGCSTLELVLESEGAQIVLTALDGTRAVRKLQEPFELPSTAEAMLLTLGPPDAAPGSAPDLVPIPVATTTAEREATTPAKKSSPLSRISIGALAGARVGGGLATPVIAALASLTAPPWELGIVGQWEMAYDSLSDKSVAPWSGSGFAVGLMLGRHLPIGSQVDLLGGARLEGVVLHQEMHHRRPEESIMRADGRVGLYAGAVIPRQTPFRVRMEVAVDTLLGGAPPPASPDVPSLPSWGASLAVGVEANGP